MKKRKIVISFIAIAILACAVIFFTLGNGLQLNGDKSSTSTADNNQPQVTTSNAPKAAPSPEPSAVSTPEPTAEPTSELTPVPTEEPTPKPTPVPTEEPTPEPTSIPTEEPTPKPTSVPTEKPTPKPTPAPTKDPTPEPTPVPTEKPTPKIKKVDDAGVIDILRDDPKINTPAADIFDNSMCYYVGDDLLDLALVFHLVLEDDPDEVQYHNLQLKYLDENVFYITKQILKYFYPESYEDVYDCMIKCMEEGTEYLGTFDSRKFKYSHNTCYIGDEVD